MKSKIFSKIPEKQYLETGVILMIVLVIAGLFTNQQVYYLISLITGVTAILMPAVFHPVAFLWFGFSKVIGTVMSKMLMGIIYYLIITPVALFRKLTGKDTLKLTQLKKNRTTVFIERSHTYDSTDMTHHY